MNHSRRPHWRNCQILPVRPTMFSSALNTPHWQVNEESTRIRVLVPENGMLSFGVDWAQSSGLTERIVKYDAKSAAKNISSLESHTMVPTETMLGRSACPCRREVGIAVVVATGALLLPTSGGPSLAPVFRARLDRVRRGDRRVWVGSGRGPRPGRGLVASPT